MQGALWGGEATNSLVSCPILFGRNPSAFPVACFPLDIEGRRDDIFFPLIYFSITCLLFPQTYSVWIISCKKKHWYIIDIIFVHHLNHICTNSDGILKAMMLVALGLGLRGKIPFLVKTDVYILIYLNVFLVWFKSDMISLFVFPSRQWPLKGNGKLKDACILEPLLFF